MFSACPRCESGKLLSSGTCPNCNYTLRVACRKCSAYNAPYAKFCGNCGAATTLLVALNHWINTNISFILQLRTRKLIAGFAFGTLLALFAFGSMGMNSHTQNIQPQQYTPSNFNSQCFLSQNALKEIDKWKQKRIQSNYATLKDLIGISDIILNNMNATLSTKSHKVSKFSKSYLKLVKNSNLLINDSINKGLTSNFLFLLVADLLNLSYSDFSGKRSFIDIPRFHYLNVPVEALEMLDINICKNDNELGISDNISIRELCSLAKSIVLASEIKVKLEMFGNLPPKV